MSRFQSVLDGSNFSSKGQFLVAPFVNGNDRIVDERDFMHGLNRF